MSLTEQGYFDRTWGSLPALGRLIGGRQPKDHWYGPSTASDNVFEYMSRLLGIYAVIIDSKDDLTDANEESKEENTVKDLDNLAAMLRHAAEYYENAANEIQTLQRRLMNERQSRQK